jgi:hypothetical protein
MKVSLGRVGLLNSTILNTSITRSIKPSTCSMFHSSSKAYVTEKEVEQLRYSNPKDIKIDRALANSDPQTAEEHFDRER